MTGESKNKLAQRGVLGYCRKWCVETIRTHHVTKNGKHVTQAEQIGDKKKFQKNE